MIVTGQRTFMGQNFQTVAFPDFPYEVWRNDEGKLCRFLHCVGLNFSIVEGEGTTVSSKGFVGHVLYDGYNDNGEVTTDAGVVKLRVPSFIKQVKMWEDFIFNRKYEADKDPYL